MSQHEQEREVILQREVPFSGFRESDGAFKPYPHTVAMVINDFFQWDNLFKE